MPSHRRLFSVGPETANEARFQVFPRNTMTDLQDILLDKLVGSAIGQNWKDGPFHVAAELIPGKPMKFTGQHGDTTAKNAIASRLGYPLMLLEAGQGAMLVLEEEDDRRAVAMGLFSTVEPGKKQKPRPEEVYRLAAVAVARHAHRLLCKSTKCGVGSILDRVLAEDDESSRDQLFDPFFRSKCPTYDKDVDLKINLSGRKTPAIARSIAAAQCCAGVYIYSGQPLKDEAGRAAREASRVAALIGGVPGAIALCVELAQRLGMPISAG